MKNPPGYVSPWRLPANLMEAIDFDYFGPRADMLTAWPADRTLGQRDLANTHYTPDGPSQWVTIRQFAKDVGK